jgi:hypothetical protein
MHCRSGVSGIRTLNCMDAISRQSPFKGVSAVMTVLRVVCPTFEER